MTITSTHERQGQDQPFHEDSILVALQVVIVLAAFVSIALLAATLKLLPL